MRRRARLLLAALVALAVRPTAAAEAPSPLDVAKKVIDAAHIPNWAGPPQFDLSPDGRMITYVTAKPTAGGEAYRIELWMTSRTEAAATRRLAQLTDAPSPDVNASPRFSPNGEQVAYLGTADGGAQVMLFDRATGTSHPLLRPEILKAAQLAPGTSSVQFAWSPDGRSIAVILASPGEAEASGGIETRETWPFASTGDGNRLALVEVGTRKVRLLTSGDIDVSALTWSPDGRHIAVAASPAASPDRYYDQDIHIIDVSSGDRKRIVALEGVDSDPSWSPDGRWIAFATQAGKGSKDWLQILGLVDVATGEVRYPSSKAFSDGIGGPRHLLWASSDRLLFTAMRHLQSPIFQLSVDDERVSVFSNETSAFLSGLATSRLSGGEILFARESFSEPRDLYLTRALRYAPERLTRLNPTLALPPSVVEIKSWRSPDGRWPLQGILVTPAGPPRPRPLITLAEGGPMMVRLQFDLGMQYPVHALVAAGYAVFVPNTRGRSGYSHAFRRAIPDEKDYVHGGYGDLISGIDVLVSKKVADPERLGIAGFSYGAFLAAYALTQTDRFKAASVNDVRLDLRGYALSFAANPVVRSMWDDQVGLSDAYDPASAAVMDAQSPLRHIDRIRTPTLLEFGMEAYGGMDQTGGLPFFQGLRRFQVPSEFIRYPRTGHGILEPRLRAESAGRNLAWFDGWLIGCAAEEMRSRHGTQSTSQCRQSGNRIGAPAAARHGLPPERPARPTR